MSRISGVAGLASDLLSAAAAAFVVGGEEERRDVERAFGADAPRICSTSVKALISAWRRSIALWRSAAVLAAGIATCHQPPPAWAVALKRGRLDAVIAGLLFMAGLRRSEGERPPVADVADGADGDGVLVIVRRGKTEPGGRDEGTCRS